jgi:hypothetical protein
MDNSGNVRCTITLNKNQLDFIEALRLELHTSRAETIRVVIDKQRQAIPQDEARVRARRSSKLGARK